eukprot:396482_1
MMRDEYGRVKTSPVLQQPLVGDSPKNEYGSNAKNSIHLRNDDLPNKCESKSPKTSLNDLIRTCALSILLLVGYIVNFTSVLISIANGKLHPQMYTWSIIYISSSAWLFFSCLVLMILTMYGFRANQMKKFFLSILFLLGVFGYATSLVIGLFFGYNNGHICWEFELLYILLPLYMIILIYFFGKPNEHFTFSFSCLTMTRLIIFSGILCTTPSLRLIQIIWFSSETQLESIFAYSSVSIATFLVILIHPTCFFKNYNSGLFFKLTVFGLLIYSITICIKYKIDFNKYNEICRIYYYYILLTALYIIYFCELLIQPHAKIICIENDMAEYL